jgi:hypothetical protein
LGDDAGHQQSKDVERRHMRNTTQKNNLPQIPQTDIEDALGQLETAFAIIGCVNGNAFTCPVCGESRKGKVILRPQKRYWKCYVCGVYPEDPRYMNAIDLVKQRCSVPFPKAVNILLGRNDGPIPKAKLLEILAEAKADDGFRAAEEEWVWDLYTDVLNSQYSSLERAQAYYADRHISMEAVEMMRFRYITDPEKLREELVAKWGEEKLVAAGLAVTGEHGFRLLCGWNYPVIEPAIDNLGKVRNMQFRPSAKQREKIRAHKRGEGPYVPTFMSIKGAGPRHLIGIGLHLLADGPGRVVMIAEGAADAAAGYTLGAAGMYAMPGTNVLPPAGVIQFLEKRGHKIVVALDGDDAGNKARPIVAEHFRAHGYANGASRRLGYDISALVSDDLEAAVNAAGEFGADLVDEITGRYELRTLSDAITHEQAANDLRTALRQLYVDSCWVREKQDMPAGLDVCDILVKRNAERNCPCQGCVSWRETHPTN